jgi:hypothetical protein
MLGSYIIHGMYPRYELLAFAYESGLKLRDSGGITDIWEWPNIKHLYAKNNTLIIVDKNNIVAHCGLAKKYGEGISKTLKRIYELWEQHLFSKVYLFIYCYYFPCFTFCVIFIVISFSNTSNNPNTGISEQSP